MSWVEDSDLVKFNLNIQGKYSAFNRNSREKKSKNHMKNFNDAINVFLLLKNNISFCYML